MGIPVISFSKYNTFNFLDHVFYVRDPDHTAKIIEIIIKKEYPNNKSIEEGSRMYHSYKAISFDAKNRLPFIAWENSEQNNYDRKLIEKIYKEMGL